MLKKRVGYAEANSLAPARDNAPFAGEVWAFVESELVGP